MAKPIKDVAASVHQRLLNLDPDRMEDFTRRLTRYALERFLYRLSISPYSDAFILKGAMLFVAWSPEPLRATRDLDLLAVKKMDAERLHGAFRTLCELSANPDGLWYDASSIVVGTMREVQGQQGWRIELQARMKHVRVKVQIDVGQGDAISPEPEWIDYPTLLPEFPAPRVLAYRRETLVAEKLAAMVELGLKKSRMKDFFDLARLAETFRFRGPDLVGAVRATFARRGIAIPADIPIGLTGEFAQNRDKRSQWVAFLSRAGLGGSDASFDEVVAALRGFLMPVIAAATREAPFGHAWSPGGPWRADQASQ